MARTTYIDLPEGQEDIYYAGLQPGDRYIFPRVVRKTGFYSRAKIEGLTRNSYLPACKVIWDTFTTEQKQAWKDVDPHTKQHGWRTFIADQCKRIKYGIEGVATPNEYHQDIVGGVEILEPAEEIKIAQYHPSTYYVSVKRQGKKNMYDLVQVTEILSLPFELTINYKSNLTSTGAGSFAKIYAVIKHFYQGVNREQTLELDLDLNSDWKQATDSALFALGKVAGYTLFIHLYKVRGTLLFDNIKVEHGGSNWCRDTYCKDISKSFTRAFYQVPMNWAAVTLPEGASFNSLYPD